MQIDIFSDPVCPWCFIGKRRLERFLADHPVPDLRIRWRVFQLNPGMPAEGMDRRAYIVAKFGDEESVRQIYERVREAGRGEGIEFNFEAIEKTPSTVNAHRLINMAADSEQQGEIVEALFRAYFLEGLDIGDREILVKLGKRVGLEEARIREGFDGDDGIEAVENEMALAASIGIQGVPCFIIDGRYAVVGAQEPEMLERLFEQIAQYEAARENESDEEDSEQDLR